MDRIEDSTIPHDPGLLAAYAEGRLDAEERRVMTLHLSSCVECRQALAMIARASGVRPQAKTRVGVAPPIWLGLAATVILATLAVRRTDAPVPTGETGETRASVVGASPGTVAPAPPAAPPAPRPAVTVADPMLDPGLLVKRGALPPRHVGGKTFRLTAGEWVDAGFDSAASLPPTLIEGPAARAAAVERRPALAPYAALGDRVVVVLDGVAYRFAP